MIKKIKKTEIKQKIKKYIMPVIAAASCAFTFFFIKNGMEKRPVIELYYCGEKVGYVDSKEVCTGAVEDAQKLLSERHKVGYKFPDECMTFKLSYSKNNSEHINRQELTDILVDDANNYFTDACGLYIDGTLVAIGKNSDEVQAVLERAMDLYSELYRKVKTEEDIVMFNSRFKMEQISVPKNSVKSMEEIEQILGIDSLENLNELFLLDNSLSDKLTVEDISEAVPELSEITYAELALALPAENIYYPSDYGENEQQNETTSVSFRSSAVEVSREVMECGEEIIYDNTLLEGKKVMLRSGTYGVKETTYNVDYIDGVEVTRTLVSEKIVKKPVAKKYKLGTKPQSEFDREEKEALERIKKRREENKAKKEAENAASKNNQPVTNTSPEANQQSQTSASAVPTGTFMFPTNGTVTSTFSGRNLFGQYEFHGALDIANKVGTAIYAADGGTVKYAAPLSTYGNCIRIDHGNGFETLYAHLDSYNVKQGDVVAKGQKIAEMGMTGRVTGPHLHFEVRVNGEKVDPLNYVNP